MGNSSEAKQALKNFSKSGPSSSELSTTKLNPVREDINHCVNTLNKLNDKVLDIQDTVNTNSGLVDSLQHHCNKVGQVIDEMKVRLHLSIGTAENPITMRSSKPTPELQDLASTLHIHDVNPLITVNPETWGNAYTHFKQLSDILGVFPGMDYIEDLIQLPAQDVDGKIQYPVNVQYLNPMKRALGVNNLQSYCKDNELSYPIQYSTINYPELKHNMAAISSTLKDLQAKGKIEWYCMGNFMAVDRMERIAPMYTIRVKNMEKPSEYKDCYTNRLYHSGFSIPTNDKDNSSKSHNTIRDAIIQQVNDLTNKHKTSYAEVVQQAVPKPLVTDKEVETEATKDSEETIEQISQEETEEDQSNVTDKIVMGRENLDVIKKVKAISQNGLMNQPKLKHASKHAKHRSIYRDTHRVQPKTPTSQSKVHTSPNTPKANYPPPGFITTNLSIPPPLTYAQRHYTRSAHSIGTQGSQYLNCNGTTTSTPRQWAGTWPNQNSPPAARSWTQSPYPGLWSQNSQQLRTSPLSPWLNTGVPRGMAGYTSPPYPGNLMSNIDYLMRIGASMIR